ncbi:hypothetical protein CO648_07585 [Rhizobium phaseoli]|nr:hypothetical protein CO648_07585 [Rhizobium phaseoli]
MAQTVDHHGPGHGYFSVPQPWSNCPASILSVDRLFATQSGLVLRKMYRPGFRSSPSSPLRIRAPMRLTGPRRRHRGAWRGAARSPISTANPAGAIPGPADRPRRWWWRASGCDLRRKMLTDINDPARWRHAVPFQHTDLPEVI